MNDIRTRLILALGAAMLLILAGLGLTAWGEHRGAALERAKWLKVDALRKDAQLKLVLANDAAQRAKQALYNLNNLKVSTNHEKELEDLRIARAADRLAADRAGGLRITRAVCDPAPAGPEAASDGRRDEAGASSVRLPPAIENDLWAIADDADEVSAQLRSCQAWIVRQGFYGPVPADNPQLLDRMLSTKNQDSEAPNAHE